MRGLHDAVWRGSYDRMEIFLGLMTLGWWLILLTPGDTFRRAQAYTFLAQLRSEGFWIVVLAVFIPLPLIAFIWRLLWLRVVGLTFKVIWWLFLACLTFLGNPITPIVPIYLLVAFFAGHTIPRVLTPPPPLEEAVR